MALTKREIAFARSVRLLNNSRVVSKTFYLEKLPKELRANAFYAAGLEKKAKIAQILKDQIVASAVEGIPFEEFQETFRQRYSKKLSKARLRTIYRNNLNNAANQAKRFEAGQSEISNYLVYDAVDDENTREDHAAFDGLVAKADDPVWDNIIPPNGHGCRCRVITASKEQADRIRARDKNPLKTKAQKLAKGRVDEGFGQKNGYGQFANVIKSQAEKAVRDLPQGSPYRAAFRKSLANIPTQVDNWYESVKNLFVGN